MRPIHFEAANLFLVKPENMTDDQCAPLSAYKGVDEEGNPYIMTMWQPNYEDIEAIKRGDVIFMKTMGTAFAPVCIFTTDENNEVNL